MTDPIVPQLSSVLNTVKPAYIKNEMSKFIENEQLYRTIDFVKGKNSGEKRSTLKEM